MAAAPGDGDSAGGVSDEGGTDSGDGSDDGVADGSDEGSVITVIDGHHYAVLVDSLEDVAPFVSSPLPSGIALDGGWREAGCGQIERDGEPILAIDLTALIHGPSADSVTIN